MFGTEKKPSQSNLAKPTLRESREEHKLNTDISDVNDTLQTRNEYDDSRYKSSVKKGNVKSSNSRSKSKVIGLVFTVNV